MKSFLVFAVLFGIAFTFTQGSAIKTQQTQSLKKCQEKKIDKLIDQIIDDTYALKGDAYKAYESAYTGALKCLVSSFTTLVSCVEGVVIENAQGFESDVQTYLSTVQTLAQKVVKEIQECA